MVETENLVETEEEEMKDGRMSSTREDGQEGARSYGTVSAKV